MKNKTLSDISLTLFFTGEVSLKTWADIGSIDRELEIYKKLKNTLKNINIVTYGGKSDRLYINHLNSIKLLTTDWHDNPKKTAWHLLLKYFPQICGSDILKTNQIQGSEVALWFKKMFGKKLIVRCGYLYSYVIKQRACQKETILNAIEIERNAFSSADIGIVTSQWQKDIVTNNYSINPVKIKVVPNYVLTNIFVPQPEIKKKYDLIFVGNAGKQKNLYNLLKALWHLKNKGRNISAVLAGSCSEDNALKEKAVEYGLNITFAGNISNFNLPALLNQARIFILPSLYEGHPKALLEAMSCGLPCIGTDVNGIKQDIEHLKTGYLCQTDFESISNAVETLLADESLQKRIGNNARQRVAGEYSVDRILETELNAIQEVIAE